MNQSLAQPAPLVDQIQRVDAPAAPPVAPLHLLHVEDNPADAMLMQEYVRGILPDVQFDTAARMSELTVSRAAAADCALLDLSLPDARGLHALHTLHAVAPELPIVVVTGLADDATSLAAVHAGAQDYLVKGEDDGRVVRRALRYAIERARSTRERDALFAREREARQAAQRAAHLGRRQRDQLARVVVVGRALLARVADELVRAGAEPPDDLEHAHLVQTA